MVFVFLVILATIAVGSMIYATYKIVQDGIIIRRLELRRSKEIIGLLKEISTCIKNIEHDNNPQTLKTLKGIFEYFKKYY